MCGIFGFYSFKRVTIGYNKVANILTSGLRYLEYRGYDSAGIAISHDGKEFIVKCSGNVKCLEDKILSVLETHELSGQQSDNIIGIAHTRWATHGVPSDVNAHPHTSDGTNMFVVVHNGIITNFKALRDFLILAGYPFASQTDTEVIPKLCQYVYEHECAGTKSLKEVVMTMLEKYLEGTYAILIKSRFFPNQMVACKKGSPMVMGVIDEYTYLFSSDVLALLSHTNKAISLHDDEMIYINEGMPEFTNYRTKEVLHKIPQLLKIEAKHISKGKYRTFMEKEIFEQPQTLTNTLAGGTGDEKMYLSHVRHCSKIICIACGTSLNSCLASRNILMKYTNKVVCIECSSDFLDREIPISSTDFCIFVSQSGETADTLQAMLYAKKRGGFCLAITNRPDSIIAREAHVAVDLNAGPEISVASTKAFTSQLLMLTMLAHKFAFNCDTVATKSLYLVPDAVREALKKTESSVVQMTLQLFKYRSILFIGRGNNYATALESALKVKEISYIHSEGILAGELKHGPLALIDANIAVVLFVTHDNLYDKMVSTLEQLKSRGAKLFIVCNEGDTIVETLVIGLDAQLIPVPKVHEDVQHIVNIIPMQLLAYQLASMKGNNVDMPRNLAKSVTVTD